MSSWLLSVAGVVVLGVLVELLLTDSSMSKFIRSIYGFFVLFVIVQPLPSFIRNAAASVSGDGGIELNTDLIQNINTQTAAAFEKNAAMSLETAGFENIIVTLDIDKNAISFTIKTAYVNALGVVLRDKKQGINIEQEVVKIVCSVCNIGEEKIFYVG